MGNEDCHVILCGGKEPNFDAASVDNCLPEIARAGLAARLMVDFSHGNSRKQYKLQWKPAPASLPNWRLARNASSGVMVESHLVEGRQNLEPDKAPTYGQSVTDACLGWDDSLTALEKSGGGRPRTAGGRGGGVESPHSPLLGNPPCSANRGRSSANGGTNTGFQNSDSCRSSTGRGGSGGRKPVVSRSRSWRTEGGGRQVRSAGG